MTRLPYDEQLIASYLEDELHGQALVQMQKQLQEDPRLRQLVMQVKGDRDLLRSMPPEALPHGLDEEMNAQLERDMLLGDSGGSKVSRPGRRLARPGSSEIPGRIVGHRWTLGKVAVYAMAATLAGMTALVVFPTLNVIWPTDAEQEAIEGLMSTDEFHDFADSMVALADSPKANRLPILQTPPRIPPRTPPQIPPRLPPRTPLQILSYWPKWMATQRIRRASYRRAEIA